MCLPGSRCVHLAPYSGCCRPGCALTRSSSIKHTLRRLYRSTFPAFVTSQLSDCRKPERPRRFSRLAEEVLINARRVRSIPLVQCTTVCVRRCRDLRRVACFAVLRIPDAAGTSQRYFVAVCVANERAMNTMQNFHAATNTMQNCPSCL